MTVLVLALFEIVWVLALTIWLLLERRSATATVAWILALAFLPGLGAGIYLLLGPRRLKRKRARHAEAREAVAPARRELDRCAQTAPLSLPHHRRIARVAQSLGEPSPRRARSVEFFFDGDSYLERLIGDVSRAERSVHAEFFIFAEGEMGRRVRDALSERARAGVEVRLLVDGFGSLKLTDHFLGPLLDAGGEVLRFHPLRLPRLRRPVFNLRNHRKVVAIDGRVAYTGGMNVDDDHLPSASGDRAWRDTQVRLEGPAAGPLDLVFLEDWHDAASGETEEPRVRPPPEPGGAGPAVQIVASGPDQDVHGVRQTYFSLFGEATERILVTTPYFVPDEAILTALGAAALRGVTVRLLLPRRSDLWLTDAAGRSHYEELLGLGVRVHLYRPGMIHAKTIVVDRDLAVVGSANLDNRSLRLNYEAVAVLYDRSAAERLAAQFDRDIAQSEELTEAPRLWVGTRLVESVARLFSPLL